jgi:hypothetical protein
LIPVDGNWFAAGVNRAASEATGRYLLLLNPTASSTATWRTCWRRLEAHPDAAVAGGLRGSTMDPCKLPRGASRT